MREFLTLDLAETIDLRDERLATARAGPAEISHDHGGAFAAPMPAPPAVTMAARPSSFPILFIG